MAPTVRQADALHSIVAVVGKSWRNHRRQIPLHIEEAMLDLLLALRSEIVPANSHLASNVKGARTQVQEMLTLLSCVANRPVATILDSVQSSHNRAPAGFQCTDGCDEVQNSARCVEELVLVSAPAKQSDCIIPRYISIA